MPSTEAQHSLSLVVWFDQSLFSWSGSTSVVAMMVIRSACTCDIVLPRNVLVTFFLLIKSQSRSPSGIQPTKQTHDNTALPWLPSRQPSLFCCTPLASTLYSSTSKLLPRSMLLDPVPQTLWPRGGIAQHSYNKLLNVHSPTNFLS